ncbi:hypothetical protein DNTS_005792, partial [Danionella cerebrum]
NTTSGTALVREQERERERKRDGQGSPENDWTNQEREKDWTGWKRVGPTDRKREIEKQLTTPKVYFPWVPSTLIWPAGSLPLPSLCLSLLPSRSPHSIFFAMPSMKVLRDSRLWERTCHVKAGYCKAMRVNSRRWTQARALGGWMVFGQSLTTFHPGMSMAPVRLPTTETE